MADEQMDALAVYIHWPYCARICPYCDFNVYKQKPDPNLNTAIMTDLAGWRDWSGPRKVTSIHFGGGTPSLMESGDVSRVIHRVKEFWGLSDDCEIAIEANPFDASESKWEAYHDAGINRLSLGVQTFNDRALKFLGRDHDAGQARSALDLALGIFPSVSLDLIFGWTGQTQAQWQADINIALAAKPHHISAYQLTIEDGTAFAKAEARGDARAAGEDDSALFYDMATEAFTEAGYEHYEVSNFAKPGHRSKHNLAYWQGRDYVGVGPGAHGRLTVDGQRYAVAAEDKPGDYKTCVAARGIGFTEKEAMSALSWAEEYVLMGLRIEEGISLGQYQDIAGQPLPTARLEKLLSENLVRQDEGRLIVTGQGRLLLNWVTEQLLIS